MSESISVEQFRVLSAKGNPRRKHVTGKMNGTERRYAERLMQLKGADEVAAFWFEQWTFKLGDDCRYTPDFIVMLADGTLEAHEVKGHLEEDALVKMRWFAKDIPIRLRCLAWTLKDGWNEPRNFYGKDAA